MNLFSYGDTFLYPFEDDESDSETTKFPLMGEEERYQIEVEFKRLMEKIRAQQDLLDKSYVSMQPVITPFSWLTKYMQLK